MIKNKFYICLIACALFASVVQAMESQNLSNNQTEKENSEKSSKKKKSLGKRPRNPRAHESSTSGVLKARLDIPKSRKHRRLGLRTAQSASPLPAPMSQLSILENQRALLEKEIKQAEEALQATLALLSVQSNQNLNMLGAFIANSTLPALSDGFSCMACSQVCTDRKTLKEHMDSNIICGANALNRRFVNGDEDASYPLTPVQYFDEDDNQK